MEIILKAEVSYKLDQSLRNEIVKVRDKITQILVNPNIYLFGSIAKGRYSIKSDIDILVLIDEEKDAKELRRIRHLLEEEIENLKISKSVDIKLYCKTRFLKLTEEPCFESSILNDLIQLGGW